MEPKQNKRRFRFYHSFEEMNEGDAREAAALSAAEHLYNAMYFIKHIYAYKGGPSKYRKIVHISYAQYSD